MVIVAKYRICGHRQDNPQELVLFDVDFNGAEPVTAKGGDDRDDHHRYHGFVPSAHQEHATE